MGELYAALAGLLVYPYVALTYIMIPKCEETIEKGNENATHCTITDILRAEIFKDGILQISRTTISGVITYNMAPRQKNTCAISTIFGTSKEPAIQRCIGPSYL